MGRLPRVVFLGTPDFAVPSLKALARSTEVTVVITQPDKPTGRGLRTEPPAVKIAAQEAGLRVIQPERVKGRAFAQQIAAYEPDFLVTAAFGRLLGSALLETPSRAALNVHASLLPRHRGAAPIAWSILSGDKETGVSIMRMARGLDAGPVYRAARTPIEPNETAGQLTARLAELGGAALMHVIDRFDELVPAPQDESQATWARPLVKADGKIDWSRSASELHNHVRALNPWPSAQTAWGDLVLKIHTSKPQSTHGSAGEPGTVLEVSAAGIDVACGQGVLRLAALQAPGKKSLCAADFLRGTRIEKGALFI